MDEPRDAQPAQSPPALDGYTLPSIDGIPAPLRVSADDPAWQAARQAAHAAGVAPAAMQALALPVMRWKAEQGRADYDAEMARLGPAGPHMVAAMETWLSGLVRQGAITRAERRALNAISNADGVRALAKLYQLISAKQRGNHDGR